MSRCHRYHQGTLLEVETATTLHSSNCATLSYSKQVGTSATLIFSACSLLDLLSRAAKWSAAVALGVKDGRWKLILRSKEMKA
mmetsp:Transcript_22699/g.69364  ORF Transcript_22699/g.69364 Transcript_22699/m.69364 type:complete len:83 (-) Transcript_22699:931-1179(-)